MPGIQTAYSAKVTNLVGKDQAAQVTNVASSGTLYVASVDTVTSTTYDFSIAAGASRVVNGPAWCVGSADIPVVVTELYVPPAQDQITPTRYYLHGPAATSTGTDTTVTANVAYVGVITIPRRTTLTGIGYLIGGTGGTHKAIAALYDKAGNVLRSSAIAGVTVGTANTYQELPFTASLEILAPGKYLAGIMYSGTTPTLRTAIVNGVPSATTASATDFSAAPVAVTVPTASTANASPQGLYVY